MHRKIFSKDISSNIGCKAPLFDLLCDNEEDKISYSPHSIFLNEQELIQSIEKEVFHILNTRRGARQAYYAEIEDESLYFGLPALFGLADMQGLDAMNSTQQKEIAKLCEKTLKTYEPRLQNISVKVENFDPVRQALILTIKAFVKAGPQLKNLHFETLIYHKVK